jgi:DNA polymerase-3 subunit beta
MDTATIAPSQTIGHKSLSAAVKAAGIFSSRNKRAPDRLKCINVTSGAALLTVESGTTDHSCRVAIPSSDTADPVSIQLDETAAAAVARFDGYRLHIIRGEMGSLSVGVGGSTLPANGNPDDLLRLPPPTGETRAVSIPWRAWVATESAIEPATDSESSRYALGAVMLQTANGRGFFIGTDGRRLHAMSAPVRGNDGTVLITGSLWGKVRKCVETVARSTTGLTGRKLAAALADTAVSVTPDGSALSIVWTDGSATVTVTAPELQGRFPRWKDVFPCRPDALRCTFDGPTLRREIRAAAVVTTEQTKAVTFRRDSMGAPAELSAVGIGGASFSGPLSGEVPAGVRVGLDPRFVQDMLDAAGAVLPCTSLTVETVRGLSAVDRIQAVVATVGAGLDATGDEYGFAAVIMPLGTE